MQVERPRDNTIFCATSISRYKNMYAKKCFAKSPLETCAINVAISAAVNSSPGILAFFWNAEVSIRVAKIPYDSRTWIKKEVHTRFMFLHVTVSCTCGTYLELRVSCARLMLALSLPEDLESSRKRLFTINESLLAGLLRGNWGNCSIFRPSIWICTP